VPTKQAARNRSDVRRRVPAAERRKRILKAARSVFAAKGYDSSSLDEIAAKAKITKPVLYDHFDSKLDLYVAVLEDASDELLDSLLSEVKQSSGGRRGKAVKAIDSLADWISVHPDHWRLLFREPVGPRRVVRAHRDIRVQASSALTAEILGSRSSGRDSLRHEMTSELLAGAMHALTEWWYEHRDVGPKKVRDVAVSVLWDGLGSSAKG